MAMGNIKKKTWTPEELKLAMDRSVAESVEEQIYRLKLMGTSIAEIAIQTERSANEVEEIIFAMAEVYRKRFAAELTIASILELDRMDRILAVLMPTALDGDTGAIDRVLAITKERRRLMGIDAPQVQLALTMSDKEEIDLSVLSTEQVEAYLEIQKTLEAAKRRGAVKGPARSRQIGGGGSRNSTKAKGNSRPVEEVEVVDAEFIDSMRELAKPVSGRGRGKKSDPQPTSLQPSSPEASHEAASEESQEPE